MACGGWDGAKGSDGGRLRHGHFFQNPMYKLRLTRRQQSPLRSSSTDSADNTVSVAISLTKFKAEEDEQQHQQAASKSSIFEGILAGEKRDTFARVAIISAASLIEWSTKYKEPYAGQVGSILSENLAFEQIAPIVTPVNMVSTGAGLVAQLQCAEVTSLSYDEDYVLVPYKDVRGVDVDQFVLSAVADEADKVELQPLQRRGSARRDRSSAVFCRGTKS